ncbi:hypothetical protein BJ912DRAFT_590001 [Pholiota molesta]|nr:hypothetical protein BJ912DRAFT_590001 [Pholiota molesta]
MLIFSVFKTLTDQTVTVELKNDLSITGVLKSVDQFLNIRLDNIKVADENRHPHMMAVKNCFIRGSVVRYVTLPAEHVDTQLLEDATRRGSKSNQTTITIFLESNFVYKMYIKIRTSIRSNLESHLRSVNKAVHYC